ncbi:DUF4139 domain-containing protein [archaeon]|nr:MAG: DUF4139 domain-containing protein [archaeon]
MERGSEKQRSAPRPQPSHPEEAPRSSTKFKPELVKVIDSMLALVVCLVVCVAWADEYRMQIGDNVKTAVIFNANQALLERDLKFSESIPIGSHTLYVTDLYSSIEDDSVRLLSSPGSSILDHKIVTVNVPKEKTATYTSALTAIENKIESLNDEYRGVKSDRDRLQFKVDSLQLFITKKLSGDNSMEASKSLEFIGTMDIEISKVVKEVTGLDQKLQKLQKALDMAKGELNELQFSPTYAPLSTVKTLVIQIKATKIFDKSLIINLMYLCNPASWSPRYDLHISTSNNAYLAQVDYYANVYQATGEDWNNVVLALSTSSPTYLSTLPVPIRRTVSRYRNEFTDQVGGLRMKSGRSAALSPEVMLFSSAAVEEEAMTFTKSASVAQNMGVNLNLDYLFKISHPVNITSNKAYAPSMNANKGIQQDSMLGHEHHQHSLLVESFSLPIKLFTYITPSTDATPYLAGYGDFEHTTPLLGSEGVRIDIDGTYVGMGRLDATSQGEKVSILSVKC